MKQFFKKHFLLPTPSELGWCSNKFNALPMKDFSDNQEKTWEAYEALMKKDYPIRSFMHYTVKAALQQRCLWPVIRALKGAVYWLKCHTLKSYKFHLLDLRQPKLLSNGNENSDHYSYGWRASDSKIVLAMFSILDNYVNSEMKHIYLPSEEETDLAYQRNAYLEVLAIHHYWKVERHELRNKYNDLLEQWSKCWKEFGRKDPRIKKLLDTVEQNINDREDEMLIRLLKVRRSMWT